MNSIRPITFVEAPLLASATFGIAALAVAFLGVTQANAAFREDVARRTLASAEAMPRGVDRDAALAKAITVIDAAVKAAPKDARIYARAARAYYLQATTAAVDDVSPTLLAAARRAVDESFRQSPDNANAAAVSALVDIAGHGGDVTSVAIDAVARSYAAPATPEGAAWRLDAATRAWPRLDATLQQTVITDACIQAARSRAFGAYLAEIAAQMPDAGFGQCATPADPS